MAYLNTTPDYGLQVSRGLVPGALAVNSIGHNIDVDVGSEDIWTQGGTWVAPTTARVHNIVSSSVNDAAAGTGARTVYVKGLDANYAIQTETVTLNGTTPVATTSSWTMIDLLLVLTAGSGAANAGTITATAVTDATVTEAIAIGENQSQTAVFQVPAGYTGYLTTFSGAYNGATNSNVGVELRVKPFGGVFNIKGELLLESVGTSCFLHDYPQPLVITEKSTVKLVATSDVNNASVAGTFDLILFPN